MVPSQHFQSLKFGWPSPTAGLAACLVLASLGMGGCASFVEEVTSRNRDLKGYFLKPDPLVVIRDSTDGAKRGQALALLAEPLQQGGTQEQQDQVFHILSVAALSDPESLCRLGAIRALGTWKDPRAVKVLEDVYFQKLPFASEISSIIRQHVVASMEKTANPEARHLMIRVARQPNATGSFQDRQQTLDERLGAIRALAKFKQYDATETLLHILETEKDVALRDRAHQSLKTATGKTLPAEAKAWRDFLHDPQNNQAPEPNLVQRVVGWIKEP